MGQVSIELDQGPIGEILSEEFERLKAKNPRYSLRSFSNKLGVHSGGLSQILKGKRNVSLKQANEFADKLRLTKEKKNYFLSSFTLNNRLKNKEISTYERIDTDGFEAEEVWIVLAVLNLIKCSNFSFSVEEISKRLNLDHELATKVYNKILSQGLVIIENGVAKRSKEKLSTTDGLKSDLIKLGHRQNLKLAKEKLESLSVNERDYTSMTFPCSLKKLEQGRELIREFQDKFCLLMEEGLNDRVFKLNIQLFPLDSEMTGMSCEEEER